MVKPSMRWKIYATSDSKISRTINSIKLTQKCYLISSLGGLAATLNKVGYWHKEQKFSMKNKQKPKKQKTKISKQKQTVKNKLKLTWKKWIGVFST